MKIDTALVHLGRASADEVRAVNPPLVRASTIVSPTLDAYKANYQGTVFDAPRYGRSGTSTTFEFQRAMAALCETEACIATSCGLSAIVAVLGAYAEVGRHFLVSEAIYAPTRAFCETELKACGVEVEFFTNVDDIAGLIRPETALIFVEAPASLTMEMYDLEAICSAAKAAGVPVAADTTWGTPLFLKPHALGVNLSVQAATKYISGHSDVMLGTITGTMEDLASVRRHCDRNGTYAAPDSCWLALRGLRTLGVRLPRHQETALQVARWLQGRSEVARVLFPALPDDPGYAWWCRQFSGAPGPFTFEFAPCSEDSFTRFIDALQLFSLGTSWGGFESLVMPAVAQHLRHLAVAPDEGRLLRLHVGLEDGGDLCADLEQAFVKMAV